MNDGVYSELDIGEADNVEAKPAVRNWLSLDVAEAKVAELVKNFPDDELSIIRQLADVSEAVAVVEAEGDTRRVRELDALVRRSDVNANDWASDKRRAREALEAKRSTYRRQKLVNSGELYFEGVADTAMVARSLFETLSGGGANPLRFDEQKLWRYDGELGVYRELPESTVDTLYQSWSGAPVYHGDKVTSLRVNSISAKVAAFVSLVREDTPIDRDDPRRGFFDDAPKGVAFANGFVAVNDDETSLAGELRELSPDLRLRHRLDIQYTPGVDWREKAPTFADALESSGDTGWFRDDEDRQEKAALLQEFAGAALFGLAPRFQSSLFLIGNGGDGKSQFTALLRALFPASSVTAIPPQELSNSFMCARLAGSRLNLCDEIPDRSLLETARFKNVVTADNPIVAGFKNQPNFEFIPKAAHVFAGNNFPSVADSSLGFWRRTTVVTWNRNFAEDSRGRRRNFARDVLAAGELDGIALWAVEGARRVLEQDGYTSVPSSEAFKRGEQVASSSVRGFVSRRCEVLDEYFDSTEALYRAYARYCEETGRQRYSLDKFGKELSRMGFGSKRVSRNGEQRMRRQLRHLEGGDGFNDPDAWDEFLGNG